MLPASTTKQLVPKKLFALISHRDPRALATEALSILIADFGATAGSLFYGSRPTLRMRQGAFSEPLTKHLDGWESSIEQRIITGPWKIAQDDSNTLASRHIPGTGQIAFYSLILDSQVVIGSICLLFSQNRIPDTGQFSTLSAYLQVVSSFMCLIGDYAFTKERLSQLSLFYQVAQSMASTFDVDKVLNDTLQLATAVLDASVSVLMMVDPENQELVFEYAYGTMGNLLRKQRAPLDEGIAGWSATHGTPVIVNDVTKDTRYNSRVDTRTGFLTESVACAPIQVRSKTIGVLQVLNKRSGLDFDAEDLSLMVTTANQAAVAIENARLYQSLREERDRIIQIQENTRRQVARNLHDGTVQFLSAISMGIDHLERLLELKPEVARAELDALRDLTRQATQQARLALFELRPLILETQGLVPALEAYVEQLQDNEEFVIHLEAANDLPNLDTSVAATIFAIIQEAVNNVKKHAAARNIWLQLSADHDCLQIVIEDNGKGFDPERIEKEYDQRGSIGLLTMRERANLIDGQMVIESNTQPPQVGTKVILQVPSARHQSKAVI